MSKLLTCIGIAQMQLDIRNRDTSKRIAQSHRCMGVSPSVDQDSLGLPHRSVNPLHQSPFEVALETLHVASMALRLQLELCLDRVESAESVDLGFPAPKQVEVGTVEEQQVHG